MMMPPYITHSDIIERRFRHRKKAEARTGLCRRGKVMCRAALLSGRFGPYAHTPISRMVGLMTARGALGWLAIAAAVSIVWLTRPFVSALLLGALMAFALEPVYA